MDLLTAIVIKSVKFAVYRLIVRKTSNPLFTRQSSIDQRNSKQNKKRASIRLYKNVPRTHQILTLKMYIGGCFACFPSKKHAHINGVSRSDIHRAREIDIFNTIFRQWRPSKCTQKRHTRKRGGIMWKVPMNFLERRARKCYVYPSIPKKRITKSIFFADTQNKDLRRFWPFAFIPHKFSGIWDIFFIKLL